MFLSFLLRVREPPLKQRLVPASAGLAASPQLPKRFEDSLPCLGLGAKEGDQSYRNAWRKPRREERRGLAEATAFLQAAAWSTQSHRVSRHSRSRHSPPWTRACDGAEELASRHCGHQQGGGTLRCSRSCNRQERLLSPLGFYCSRSAVLDVGLPPATAADQARRAWRSLWTSAPERGSDKPKPPANVKSECTPSF